MDEVGNDTYEFPEGFLPTHEMCIFWCVFLSLEAFFITLLNFLTIVTFAINPHLRKRSTYGIINLAFADLLVGAVSIPLNVHFLGVIFAFWESFYLEHDFANTVYVFTGMSSLFALVLISLERVLATAFPLRHRTTSYLTYVLGIVLTWLLAGVVTTVWLFSYLYIQSIEVSLYLWMPALLGSLFIVSVAYISIFVAVKRHNSKRKDSKTRGSFQREKELALTLFIVTAISLSCWIPFAVMQTLNFNNVILPINISYIPIVFANANSLINPVIYVFRMLSFRHALYMLMTKCSRDRGWRKRHTTSGMSVSGALLSRRRATNSSLTQLDTTKNI